MPPFLMLQERSCSGAIFLKDYLFGTSEANIIFPRFFFEKDHLSFSAQTIRSYFRGKEISSFLMIQEISYSSATFLERQSFQNIWKKKMWFFVQSHTANHFE